MSLESNIQNLSDAIHRLAEGVEKLLSIQLDAEVLKSIEDLPTPLEAELEATALPTFEDAKRAFLAIAQKFGAVDGTAKSKDVLARYGVPNLKALKPELYGEFIELCDHVVAGGAA